MCWESICLILVNNTHPHIMSFTNLRDVMAVQGWAKVCVISTVVCEVVTLWSDVILELGSCEDFPLCTCVGWECVDIDDNQKKKMMYWGIIEILCVMYNIIGVCRAQV